MATTDYLQKIRGSKRVQDFIWVNALFNALKERLDSWESRGIFSSEVVDWFRYRLHVKVVDLSNRWDDFCWAWIKSCTDTIIVERLGNAVVPLVPCQFIGLFRPTRCIEFRAIFKHLKVYKNHQPRLPPADTKLTGFLSRIWSISGLQYSG